MYAATPTILTAPPPFVTALLATPPLPDAPAGPVPGDGPPVSLLHALLRHAFRLEAFWAAARLLAAQPAAAPLTALLRDAELVGFGPTPAPTWRTVLGQPSPVTDGRAPAAVLAALTRFDGPAGDPRARFVRFREALGQLAALDAPTLERLMVGTLDTGSHRLDAWITSLAVTIT